MNCPTCDRKMRKHGTRADGRRRFRCVDCKKVHTETREHLFGDMRIDESTGLMALQLLCEGASVRAVVRITGLHKATVLKLLVLVGERVERFMAETIKDIPVEDVECDETWSYIGQKERSKKKNGVSDPQQGDAYTWLALERSSKLVLCWHLGRRNNLCADAFAEKLANATSGRFQVSTDGFEAYVDSLSYHVGDRTDYAMIRKEFGYEKDGQRQYAPPALIRSEKAVIYGEPNEKRVCTSHVERLNASLRMGLKRATRLTIAFSKCFRNHKAALSLWLGYYNFVKTHRSIRMPPAVKAGVTKRPWSMRDLVEAAMMGATTS